MNTEVWTNVNSCNVSKYCEISNFGNFRYNIFDDVSIEDPYISSNGLHYQIIVFNDLKTLKMFRTDILVAINFVDVPASLLGKSLTVKHIDGDLNNNHYENLRWVEDIEEWKEVSIDGIVKNRYYVSSFGRFIDNTVNIPNIGRPTKGYRAVYMQMTDNTYRRFALHRIVGYMFLKGNKSLCINHIDGDKTNNRIDNIEYVDRSRNNLHARKMNLNFSNCSGIMFKIIKHALQKSEWSPTSAVVYLHKMGFDIPETSVTYVKKNLLKNDDPDVKKIWFKKLNNDKIEIIRGLLIRYNGDKNLVLNDLKKLYPDTSITKYNIGTVKANMKSYHFPNMRLNRKISEKERVLLINLLEKYDMSPSKAFKHIDEVSVENVTIHDLKYIKRKLTY